MKNEAPKSPNRPEVENLILTYFTSCPFCKQKAMQFTWGSLVPKRMICQNCGALWEPYMSYDGKWAFMSATLVKLGKEQQGANLLNKMYPASFWLEKSSSEVVRGTENEILGLLGPNGAEPKSKQALGESDRVVIIREVVKIRCRYCGSLYDETNDRCPHCGGMR